MNDKSNQLIELAKRRGFFMPSNESYGGTAGFYTFGPRGAALKRNLEQAWRERFVIQEGNMEIESPDVLPSQVLEASGHVDAFTDMLIECPDCGGTHRADHLIEDQTDINEAEGLPIDEAESLIDLHGILCPDCGRDLSDVSIIDYNLMFKTMIGPEGDQDGYLRPETAQGIFVEFPSLAEYARGKFPFGVAQLGNGYRNEISPRRALIRTREFMLAELQEFVDPEGPGPDLDAIADTEITLYPATEQEADSEEYVEKTVQGALADDIIRSEWLAYYVGVTAQWFRSVGVDPEKLRYRQHLSGERAHYASDCWDAEAKINGVWTEITGLAYRSDYDLQKHHQHSNEEYTVFSEYEDRKEIRTPTISPDMSYLGPKYGSDAEAVVQKLEALAEREPSRFEGDTVKVEMDGEEIEVPTEHVNFEYVEKTIEGEQIMPHVIEPSIGIGRVLYTVLHHSYRTDEVDSETRTRLQFPPEVAPISAGVFPLRNEPALNSRAREVVSSLQTRGIKTIYDDSGSIGRRYRRQDEIGTPFCITVDKTPEEGNTATIRERDSLEQVRVEIDDLPETVEALLHEEVSLEDVS